MDAALGDNMIPEHIIIGDDVTFTIYNSQYLDKTRTMMLRLYNVDAYDEFITEVFGVPELIDNKQTYTFTLTSEQTSKLSTKDYIFKLMFTEPAQVTVTSRIVKASHVDVLNDEVTRYAAIIDAIDATLLGRATKDQEAYTIGNRSISRIPVEQLTALRLNYKRELAGLRERMKAADAKSQGKTYLNKNIIRYTL